jgi:dTDP-4-amino-4,6-dideoxygalactose transaminase
VIPVTRPFLPELDAYVALLREVWDARWLTNQGPKAVALEAELTRQFAAPTLLLANGTLALQLAIRALGLRRRVATTPFSFVATCSAPVWEGCEPVFVDIDPGTLNLSPDALGALDVDGVTGVVATHVYGVACDIDRIRGVSADRGWKVLYDGAHAFGTTWRGAPVMSAGDATATSFHATKLFHTGEGGAVVSGDAETLARVGRMRSFGEREKGEFVEVGINAKSSELHAAMGLAVLPHVGDLLARRRHQGLRYRANLGGRVRWQEIPLECGYNYAYVPILLSSESDLLRIQRALHDAGVQTRRYFHPSLSTLSWVARRPTPVADDVARRVLCLPVFHELADADLDRICAVVDAGVRPAA